MKRVISIAERDAFIEKHHRLIHMVLARWGVLRQYESEYEDLVQEGIIVLMNCAQYYDPSIAEESTFCVIALRRHLAITLRKRGSGNLFRAPHSVRVAPTDSDDVANERLGKLRNKEERDAFARMENDEIMRCLPPRHKQVLRMRFCEERKLDEIGEIIGTNGERVRQIVEEAINKIRKRYKNY